MCNGDKKPISHVTPSNGANTKNARTPNPSNPPLHGAVSCSKLDSRIGEITSHVCKTGQCTSAEIIAL